MTICDNVSSAMINASSNENHMNGNNTTISSYFLLDGAAALVVASPWEQRVYSVQYLNGYGMIIKNK